VSVTDGTIFSATQTKGNAGEVRIIANGDLTVDGETGTTAISANSFDEGDESTGDAGNVFVDVQGNVELINGGKISSDSFSGTNVARGDAGDVTVNALGNMVLNGSSISTDTSGIGQGGNVIVNVGGNLTIDGQGEDWGISSLTHLFPLLPAPSEAGNSGSVNVNVQGGLNVINGGEISSASLSSGNAGTVAINAHAITLSSGGGITSATSAKGSAGDVTVKADTLRIDTDGLISAAAQHGSEGQIGDVNVQATDSIILSHSGKISIENSGTAADLSKIISGSITVTAPNIDMQDSEISSNSTGNVAAGNITVNFSHWLTMDPSFISTTANTGNGGFITINGGELIYLQNSGFKTTVSGVNSNGGDIFTTADILVMDTGLIQANAIEGFGGNITLNLDSLIPSGNTLLLGGSTIAWQPFMSELNVIQAASQAGVSGTVSVTAPQLNLSGIIANLGGPQFDTGIISQDYCGLGAGSSLTRKGAGGLKPKSTDQLLF
jgi:large exoprotein involved in heme utilization and adhesion